MKKISSLILLIIVSLFIVTGCDSQSNNKANNQMVNLNPNTGRTELTVNGLNISLKR